MKRVGVTGAAGFIGSHLCDRLLDRGIEVVGVDDLSRGSFSTSIIASTDPRSGSSSSTARSGASCELRSTAATPSCTWPRRRSRATSGTLMTLESNVAGVQAASERRSGARRGPPRRVDLGRVRKRHAAVRRGRPARARAARRHAAGRTRSRSSTTSTSCSRLAEERGLRVDDPAPLRLLRPAQPSDVVGRPAGGVPRDAARRRHDRHPRRRPADADVHLHRGHGRRHRARHAHDGGAR